MDTAPPSAEPRKASTGDAMILIFAFAVGLAISLRPMSDMVEWYGLLIPSSRFDLLGWWTAFARKLPPQFLLIQGGVQLLFCLIIPLTLALIVARLRQPRPSSWRLQPGFVASVALCLAAVVSIDVEYFNLIMIPPLIGSILPGGAVLFSWLVLLTIRRWHPEAGWIDRSGRVVGALWLATIPWSLWVAN
ncbi:hypothetical protein SAMN05444166_5445 [Singulisphaera sp. GP187]|uniref:hypothetical protein n=1 Tax=Singulisphaera sp. GP187 TaxID=1882752 RepID=UPI00092BC91F|nr:hypothetical protein [Singulisphaera sp. GP187]SIO57616.1 hypothetical protein SAMN05444166_5445 [Singulisphaera sp. GP187]